MSETNGVSSSVGTDGQADFNAGLSLQTPQNAQQNTDKQSGKAAANNPSTDKKPSMVEYCRKNIC